MALNPRYIVHIADVHIGSGQRSAEYRQVFNNLFVTLSKFDPSQLLIIIAGDIFHHKNRYSGDDIADFNYLLEGLISLYSSNDINTSQIIIIPGNHDANLNNKDLSDLITPLVANNAAVKYWKNSGFYQLLGLKFYHFSVYDESDRNTFEQFANTAGDLNDTILIYHGPIDGAKFGSHTVKDSRISSVAADKFRLLIAGDIHQHQFISPKVAYPGSLIQQNLGEKPEKGIIIWDLNGNIGQFVRISNDHGFIKLDLRGKTQQQCVDEIARIDSPAQLLKLSVITDANDENINEQIARVEDKFGKINRVDRVMKTNIKLVDDITETLGEILLSHGATDEQLIDITNMHIERIARYDCKKWTVTSLKWDNMFKYGPGNCIDFLKLDGGISGVIADNRAGKSSIIDVLVFGLFGELLRGNQRSMVRYGAKESHIRVDFIVNDIKYYVERHDDRNRNSRLNLSKLVAPDKWVNITEKAIDETYRKIKTMIGSVNQFLATGLYYDSLNDIIKMSKIDRMKILPELFGMTDNEIISREIKLKLKAVKDKIAALIQPRTDNPDAEHKKKIAQLAQLNKDRDEKEHEYDLVTNEINISKAKVNNLRPREIITRDVADLRSMNEKMYLDIHELSEKIYMEIRYADKPASVDTTNIAKLAAQKCQQSGDLQTKIGAIKLSLPQTLSANIDVSELNEQVNILGANISSLRNDNARLQLCRDNLGEKVSISGIEDIIEANNSRILALKYLPINDKYEESLTKRALNAQSSCALKFDEKCNCCAENKRHVANDLCKIEEELSRIRTENETARKENQNIENQIKAISAESLRLKNQIKIANDIDKICAKIVANDLAIAKNENKLSEINIIIRDYEAHQAKLIELKQLSSDLDLAVKIEKARKMLESIRRYEQYLYCSRRDKLMSDIAVNNSKIVQLEEELSQNAALCEEKCILDEFIDRAHVIKSELSMIDKNIGAINAEVNYLAKELAIFNDYNRNHPPLQAEHDKLKLYVDCIGSAGLRTAIIKKNIDRIITSANNTLLSVTNFTLQCEVNDASIEFLIAEPNGGPVLPAILGSGFQKFITSLAIRFALTSSLPSAPEFIVIDEGFGCMDANNIARSADMFSGLRDLYKFVFIISHVSELQNSIEVPLMISLEENQTLGLVSHINNGEAMKIEPPIENDPDSILCDCGVRIKKKSLPVHEKSIKHIKTLRDKKT